jgi:hypothetical protein
MTDERNRIDSGADTDTGVTQAYRDTKDERAPEALNRAILDQAAKTAQPRYSRVRLWTRPMAWAATVMLSVAIVFQLTQVPTPTEIGFDGSADEVDAPANIPAERLEEATGSSRKTEALRSTAKQSAPTALSETRQREQQTKATFAERNLAEQEPAVRALTSPDQASLELDSVFELKDQDMLQRTDDMPRIQEGEDQQAVPATAPPQAASTEYVSLGLVSEPSEPGRCAEAATATPEAWLQCIAFLEEAGLTEAAAEERELLAAAFPDFETP